MGQAFASLRATGQQQALRRKLPPAPLSHEHAALDRLAAQELHRMVDVPSMEELGRKDASLDQLLSCVSAGSCTAPTNMQLRKSPV